MVGAAPVRLRLRRVCLRISRQPSLLLMRILVHPGSSSPAKRWHHSKWVEFIAAIRADGHSIDLVGGPAEIRYVQTIASAAKITATTDLALGELVRRIQAADAYIGHDSGPAHIAAGCGKLCLLLWWGDDEQLARWKPTGDVTIVRGPVVDGKNRVDTLTVQEALGAFRSWLL